MKKRVFVRSMQPLAVGALVLGAAGALSGCTGNAATTGAAQTTATGSATQAAAQNTATATATGAAASPIGNTNSRTSQGSSPDSRSSGAPVPACATGQIGVKYSTGDAGLGHRSAVLLFTNNGSGPCTLTGYPGAGVTDRPGTVVLNAQRSLSGYLGGATNVATVTLARGGRASALIEWLDAPTNGQEPVGANCPGMDGGELLVTPPNTTVSTAFATPVDLCSDFYVHPVVPNTSGTTRD